MNFIQYDETPLLAPHPLHDPFSFPGALGGVTQHGVGADGHRATYRLVLRIRSEAADLRVVNSGPHLELGLPLLHRYRGITQHQAAFAHRAGRCHPDQGFTRSCKTKIG